MCVCVCASVCVCECVCVCVCLCECVRETVFSILFLFSSSNNDSLTENLSVILISFNVSSRAAGLDLFGHIPPH